MQTDTLYALYLADAIKDSGLPREEFQLKVGAFGAEPWTEIMHQGNLFFSVATGHRNNRSADILGSGMCSQSARKQSVSV